MRIFATVFLLLIFLAEGAVAATYTVTVDSPDGVSTSTVTFPEVIQEEQDWDARLDALYAEMGISRVTLYELQQDFAAIAARTQIMVDAATTTPEGITSILADLQVLALRVQEYILNKQWQEYLAELTQRKLDTPRDTWLLENMFGTISNATSSATTTATSTNQ